MYLLYSICLLLLMPKYFAIHHHMMHIFQSKIISFKLKPFSRLFMALQSLSASHINYSSSSPHMKPHNTSIHSIHVDTSLKDFQSIASTDIEAITSFLSSQLDVNDDINSNDDNVHNSTSIGIVDHDVSNHVDDKITCMHHYMADLDSMTSQETAKLCQPSSSPSSQSSSSSSSSSPHPILSKYTGRIQQYHLPSYPDSEVYLCGTVHVSKTSVDMVYDAIHALRPQYIIIELCQERAQSLYHHMEEHGNDTISIREVMQVAWEERSLRAIWTGMLMWMQASAAKILGSELGGELLTAAREGAKLGSYIILGDRDYHVTIARIFDKLSYVEMMKTVVIGVWEAVTLSLFKLKDYVSKTEMDEKFIDEEIASFNKYLPSFAEVLIHERDEYIAQSILETLRLANHHHGHHEHHYHDHHHQIPKKRFLAVIGAGHVKGVGRLLQAGGSSRSRLAVISSSSKHLAPTWPEDGSVPIIDSQLLIKDQQQQHK